MARNKSHKSRFASKSAVARKAQGRTEGGSGAGAAKKTGGLGVTKSGNPSGHKARNRQSADAIRKNKNEVVRVAKCIGFDGAPRICGIVNANESGDSAAVYRTIVAACANDEGDVQNANANDAEELGVPRTVLYKPAQLRMTLVCEGNEIDEQVALDIAKVSDIVILSLDCSSQVQETLRDIQQQQQQMDRHGDDDDGDDNDYQQQQQQHQQETRTQGTWFSDVGLCITDQTRELVQYINAQGSPSIVVVLQGLDTYDARRRRQVERIHERYFASVLCAEHRVVSEPLALLRACETMKLRKLHFREIRPYFVADDGDYDEDARELHLSGYLRGSNLSATQLVHLTNHGTFQIRAIVAVGDPCPAPKSSVVVAGAGAGAGDGVVEETTEDQREPLVETMANETLMTDDMEGLPTAADVFAAAQEREAADNAEKKRIAAMHEAAAAAAADSGAMPSSSNAQGHIDVAGNDEELQPDNGDDDDGMRLVDQGSRLGGGGGGGGGIGGASAVSGRTDVEFKRSADILRFERQTDAEREEDMRRLREEAEEHEYNPDEKETPFHIPARQRFQKFRGMKSFHAGKWDPCENLPIEFGHIFKFRGFNQVREQAVRAVAEGPAPIGLYVRITLVSVGPEVWENASDLLLVSGLLPHEHKWSVLHFRTQRNAEYAEPVKSKTPMLAHIGFRKFFVQPLFSEPVAMGGGRTKYSRYLMPSDNFKSVSFFGPISYFPTPILLFKALSLEEQSEGVPPPLVCFGSALPPDPDFLILKRVTLTGRIAVIYKKQIVVRYMFWNEDDVKYFQPVDLYTRMGRRGKIKKAVGTHGMFKAELNDMTMQHDVVCLDLWKRIFPKWKTVPFNVSEIAASTEAKRQELAREEDVFED